MSDKLHAYRAIAAEYPTWTDRQIADVLGVTVRTIQGYRAKLRETASQARSDARHCRLKLAGRA